MGEHLRHIQCKVITFVMAIQRFVMTIMIDIELMVTVNNYQFGGKMVLKLLKLHCFYI